MSRTPHSRKSRTLRAQDASQVKIGLEVHCQLTCLATKLFCSCPVEREKTSPNSSICPVCFGIPGALPKLNGAALDAAILVGLALECNISGSMLFFRKNYFYPDMPKNFQISQYDKAGGMPLAVNGHLTLNSSRTIRIGRIHLEEDPGKLVYEGSIAASRYTLVDYNRAGVALLEIVTEPDIQDAKEAREFLEKLRSILENLGVSNGSLEGAMRCDANISVASGKRVEIKNVTSFKEVERALNFEITRQSNLLRHAANVGRETRHWDEARRITISLRQKEEEEDYRYFPEPDLVPIHLDRERIEMLRRKMPEMSHSRAERFMATYNISLQAAGVLASDKALADYFEDTVQYGVAPREVGNWLTGEVLGYLNEANKKITDLKMTPQHLASLVEMIVDGKITGKMAKPILQQMLATGRPPGEITAELGVKPINKIAEIESLVEKAFAANKDAVDRALTDEKVANYLVGEIIRLSEGKAEPRIASELVKRKLAGLRGS